MTKVVTMGKKQESRQAFKSWYRKTTGYKLVKIKKIGTSRDIPAGGLKNMQKNMSMGPMSRENMEKGMAAIEFALVLPVLLLFLMGIIEYGWLFKTQIELNNAVSASACAVVKEKDSAAPADIAVAVVCEALDKAAEASRIQECLTVTNDSAPSRARITLSQWHYDSLTGFLPEGMLPTTLSATAVMAYP